jgi:hypothetical protein
VVTATGKRRSRHAARPRTDSDAALAALSQHRDEWA